MNITDNIAVRPQIKRREWTREEKAAVFKHLGSYVKRGVVPSKAACEQCMKRSGKALARREWRGVKFCVKNEITKRKRLLQKTRR